MWICHIHNEVLVEKLTFETSWYEKNRGYSNVESRRHDFMLGCLTGLEEGFVNPSAMDS